MKKHVVNSIVHHIVNNLGVCVEAVLVVLEPLVLPEEVAALVVDPPVVVPPVVESPVVTLPPN